MYIQQGDVLLKMQEKFPKTFKVLKTNLIHKGDNHHHKIRGDFEIYETESEMFLLCKDKCELFHEEHKTIEIPEGLYKKKIVLEYDHLLEESRMVID